METMKKIGLIALVAVAVIAVVNRAKNQFPVVQKIVG